MTMKEIMRNVPNGILTVIVICVTVAFLGTVATMGYLATAGADSSPVTGFIDTALNFVLLVITGTGATAAISAAKSAAATERQTNGELKQRVKEVVAEALTEHLNGDNQDG